MVDVMELRESQSCSTTTIATGPHALRTALIAETMRLIDADQSIPTEIAVKVFRALKSASTHIGSEPSLDEAARMQERVERLAVALERAEAGLTGMTRLSDMGLEQSLAEPEENGNFAAYNRAVEARDLARASLSTDMNSET